MTRQQYHCVSIFEQQVETLTVVLMFFEQTGSHIQILPSEDALLQSPHPALQQHQHICTCCAVPPGGKRGSPPVPSSTGSEESVELLTSCQSAFVKHQSEFTGCRINNGQMVIFVTSGNNEKVDVMKCSICGKNISTWCEPQFGLNSRSSGVYK